jgi:hypothetical protein
MRSPATDVPAEFILLGPVDIILGGLSVQVTGGRNQIVLAMLLLEAGRVVPVDRLMTALWAEDPPATARSQMQICVSALRRLLARTGAALLTHLPGYLLRLPDGSLDLWRFRELCKAADSLAQSQPAEAVGKYREALALWRGEACASVTSGIVAQAAFRLNEERWELAARRHWRISRMVERLTDEQQRLNELDLEGTSIRATLELSYRGLPPPAQLLMTRLGLLDTAEFPAWISAPLLDLPATTAEDVLEDLVAAGLVEARITDDRTSRYRMREMVRLFAKEKLGSASPDAERIAAMRRYLGCWLTLIGAAHRRLHGGDFHIVHGAAPLWTPPAETLEAVLVGPLDWFREDGDGLIEAIFLAARLRLDEFCWDLAATAVDFFELGGYLDEWQRTHQAALGVVREAGNERGTAALLHSLGVRATSRDVKQARRYLNEALAAWRRAGDVHGEALSLICLANIVRRGDLSQAEERLLQVVDLTKAAGDIVGEGYALLGLANVRTRAGQPLPAADDLRRADTLARDSGDLLLHAQVLLVGAELWLTVGATDTARDQIAVARDALAAIGAPPLWMTRLRELAQRLAKPESAR